MRDLEKTFFLYYIAARLHPINHALVALRDGSLVGLKPSNQTGPKRYNFTANLIRTSDFILLSKKKVTSFLGNDGHMHILIYTIARTSKDNAYVTKVEWDIFLFAQKSGMFQSRPNQNENAKLLYMENEAL